MKLNNNSRLWVGIMLPLIMLVFFVLLVFSMVRLFEAGQAMRLEAPHNMLWVSSQAHAAGLKLALALEKHEKEASNPAALQQAHEVWLSRIALFKEGPQERELHAMGFERALLAVEEDLPFLRRYMNEVLQGNTTNLPWLQEWIEKNNQLFSNMSTESMVYEWEKLGGKLDLEREGLWTVTVSLSVILVAGAIVAFYLVLVLRESRRRAEQLSRAEREIAQHRDHLEELVDERTQALDAALERERLFSELSRNFGAMLSHQFRTPLAVVDSSLQRLIRRKDKLTPAEVEERGMRARRAIKRLIALITSTLDAARLDAGQVEARKQTVNLEQLVKRVVEVEQMELTHRNITFDIEGKPSDVLCDATHVEHIVMNLLSNAVKYSPPHSPIDISLRYGEQQVECQVCNQGTLEAAPDSIFNRYYRGDNLAGTSGIGLGLYMAKMLARLQGGDVFLGEHDEQQVCFVLALPTEKPLGVINASRRK